MNKNNMKKTLLMVIKIKLTNENLILPLQMKTFSYFSYSQQASELNCTTINYKSPIDQFALHFSYDHSVQKCPEF